MRNVSGASFSWRTSQFTLVSGRPSRGASSSVDTSTLLARRSAVTVIGPTVFGMRSWPSSRPVLASDASRACARTAGSDTARRESTGCTSIPSWRPSRRQA